MNRRDFLKIIGLGSIIPFLPKVSSAEEIFTKVTTAVPSALPHSNAITNGNVLRNIKSGEIIVIGGFAGSGKTRFLLNEAKNMIGKRILFVAAEGISSFPYYPTPPKGITYLTSCQDNKYLEQAIKLSPAFDCIFIDDFTSILPYPKDLIAGKALSIKHYLMKLKEIAVHNSKIFILGVQQKRPLFDDTPERIGPISLMYISDRVYSLSNGKLKSLKNRWEDVKNDI